MFVSHAYHIFCKLSDSPLVYGTTTYPTLGLGLVIEVPSVLMVQLLRACEAMFSIISSGSLLQSC